VAPEVKIRQQKAFVGERYRSGKFSAVRRGNQGERRASIWMRKRRRVRDGRRA
jgi:hypothetical protein